MVLFAAATGLRPGEWIALEQRDIDREARVVYVRRAFRNGRLKMPKTKASIRAVPLQAVALAALDAAAAADPDCLLLFPSVARRPLRSAQLPQPRLEAGADAAGITPLRRIYDLGTRSRPSPSVPASPPSTSPATWERASTMIDRHYGHLARDGREHAIKLLDTYRAPSPSTSTRWTPRGRRTRRPPPTLTTETAD